MNVKIKKKYRLTFTFEELKALSNSLVHIAPSEYDLHTYCLLRELHGRFEHLLLCEQ